MPDMTLDEILDEIRDAIARHKGWVKRNGGWEMPPMRGIFPDHPVPASLDWVSENWPKEWNFASRWLATPQLWSCAADRGSPKSIFTDGYTELHARMAMLLAVLEAEGNNRA